MMERINQVLNKTDPRLITLIAVFLVLFLAVEGWLLVLRKPYADYSQLTEQRDLLQTSLSTRAAPSVEIEQLTRDVKDLSDRLNGELQLTQAGDRVVASLMETLDHSAQKHGLKLSSVKPMEQRSVSGFEEIPFDVSVTGAYLPLSEWMLGFGESLGGNVSITDFDMHAGAPGGKVVLTLRLALYLPSDGKKKP